MTFYEEITEFCERMELSTLAVFLIAHKDDMTAIEKHKAFKFRNEEDQTVRRFIQQYAQKHKTMNERHPNYVRK